MTVILFEDERVADLYPATLGRPAFSLSCGGYRLLELAARLGPVRAVVRSHLADVLCEDAPELLSTAPIAPPVLAINARLVPRVSSIERLADLLLRGEPCIVRHGESIAAMLSTDPLPSSLAPLASPLSLVSSLLPHPSHLSPSSHLTSANVDLPLFDQPHDLVRHHPLALLENLQDRLAMGEFREVTDGVFVAPEATLGQYVVTDVQQGPIVIDRGARVGPLSVLHGPCYLGPGAIVNEQSSLRPVVAVGRGCRVGGEMYCDTFEPYSNKQHYGFLGHSYVGSWVNLGAGTTNSNLKNTYGMVTMRYGERKVATDMQFMGAIFGDYAKTAIGAMLFTGKLVGAGSMVYGWVPTNVPSFVNYAMSLGQTTAADFEVLAKTHRRMFGRRGVAWRDCDEVLLRAMYDLTAADRTGLSVAPLTF